MLCQKDNRNDRGTGHGGDRRVRKEMYDHYSGDTKDMVWNRAQKRLSYKCNYLLASACMSLNQHSGYISTHVGTVSMWIIDNVSYSIWNPSICLTVIYSGAEPAQIGTRWPNSDQAQMLRHINRPPNPHSILLCNTVKHTSSAYSSMQDATMARIFACGCPDAVIKDDSQTTPPPVSFLTL